MLTCKSTAGYSVYTKKVQKKAYSAGWRFFELVICAVNESRPSHSIVWMDHGCMMGSEFSDTTQNGKTAQ